MKIENFKKCVSYVDTVYQQLKDAKRANDYFQVMILTAQYDTSKNMLAVVCYDKWESEKENNNETEKNIMKTYQKIHSLSQAIENCIKSGNAIWQSNHESALASIMENSPSGSGFDDGTILSSVQEHQMLFETSFHHMDEMGGYDGWTNHVVYVKPSFDGITLRITGKNKNDIKEYIGDVFFDWLNSEIN